MTKQLVVGDTAQTTTDTNTDSTDTESDADTDTIPWRSRVAEWVRHHTPTIGLQQQCPHCHGAGEITTERERRLDELSTQQMRFLQQAYLEREKAKWGGDDGQSSAQAQHTQSVPNVNSPSPTGPPVSGSTHQF